MVIQVISLFSNKREADDFQDLVKKVRSSPRQALDVLTREEVKREEVKEVIVEDGGE